MIEGIKVIVMIQKVSVNSMFHLNLLLNGLGFYWERVIYQYLIDLIDRIFIFERG